MKVFSIVGARPQFIKEFAFSQALGPDHEEVLVHTGQHYDDELSDVFFEELGLSHPEYNLGVGSSSHAVQTAEILAAIEPLLDEHQPDVVLVYGDTNSTLAGAIATAKMETDLAHVEAGLRSFNRDMPEDINRILTDHVSDLLFAPSERAVANLREENIEDGVHYSGDVMYDALLAVEERARTHSTILEELSLEPDEYVLSTIHRPRNTDDRKRLEAIIEELAADDRDVVLPLHPRTRAALEAYDLLSAAERDLIVTEPVGYVDFVRLMSESQLIVTDSGGVQKEALFLNVPCVTLREETEWNETVETGWNVLVGADRSRLRRALQEQSAGDADATPYGDGTAADAICSVLDSHY
jgi:UDP-N-acetylglucosamine 2-epimerase (non-hydrolysing)